MDQNFPRLLATLKLASSDTFRSSVEIQDRLAAQGFVVSARTVQRDLEALAKVYDLECRTDAKPFQWRWRKGQPRITIPGMDWPEAVSFRLLEDYLVALLPGSVGQHLAPYFAEARHRLAQSRPGIALQKWPAKVRVVTPGPALIEPGVAPLVHELVSEALLSDRQLEIHYRSVGSAAAKKHTVNPLGLVMVGRTMYLVASYPKYDEPRTLALHRMEKAAVLTTACVPPPEFSLDNYAASGGFGCGGTGRIALDATWHDSAGIHLIQSKLAPDQVVEEVDRETTRIKANVLHTERLVWWLLSFGDRVEVHAPRALRKEVADSHRAAAEHYAPRKNGKPAAPSRV